MNSMESELVAMNIALLEVKRDKNAEPKIILLRPTFKK